MKTLTLQLTIDDANLILEALGNQPYVKVFSLITKFQAQASQQLVADDAPPPVAASAADLTALTPKE